MSRWTRSTRPSYGPCVRRRSRILAWSLASLWSATLETARASSDGSEALLSRRVFEAPDECPGEEAFFLGVNERRRGSGSPDGLELRTLIVRRGGSYEARIRVGEGQRIVTCERCDAVVDAAAIVVALMLDSWMEIGRAHV